MLKIPKIAHCFWYAPDGLPYLRYISIASFALLNPDYLVKIYSLEKPLKVGKTFDTHEQCVIHITRDYFPDLIALKNIQLINLDKSFLEEVNLTIDTAVHWSDILRIKLLSTEGGFWFDSDIIFTRSLANSYLGYDEFNNIDTIISHTSLGSVCAYLSHRIGFLASSPKNTFYQKLWEELLKSCDYSGNYQEYGAVLYNRLYPTTDIITKKNPSLSIHSLPNCALYTLHLTELLSNRLPIDIFIGSPFVLGCHWYGGGDHLIKLINQLNNSSDLDSELDFITKKNPSIIIMLFDFARKLVAGKL